MIPNRKPSTPLMELYSLGSYRKKLTQFQTHRRHQAVPSTAAVHKERNPSATEEVNVKPSLHDRFSAKFYVPGKYLNPYGSVTSSYVHKLKPEADIRVEGDIQHNFNNKAFITHRPIEKKYQSMRNSKCSENRYESTAPFEPREDLKSPINSRNQP